MATGKETSRRRRIFRIAFFTFLSVMLLSGIAAFLFVKYYLTPYVKNKIITSVHNSSGGLYNLSIDEFNLDFWSGGIRMENAALVQDTTVLHYLRTQDSTSNLSELTIDIRLITISRIWWQNFLFNKNLEVGKVVVWDPLITINGKIPDDTLKVSKQSVLDVLPGLIASFAGSLQIERFSVNNAKLKYDLAGNSGVTKQNADSIFIILSKIRIDTAAPHKTLYTDYVTFHMQNYKLETPDQLYILDVRKLWGSYHDSTLAMEDIKLSPRNYPGNNDFYGFKIKRLTTSKIDFPLFFKSGKVVLGDLMVDAPSFELRVTKDPDKAKNKRETIEKFLVTSLLPYVGNTFSLKSFRIKNGNLATTIIKPKGIYEYNLGNIDIGITGIQVDSSTINSGHYWQHMTGHVRNYTTKIHSYNLKIDIGDLQTELGNVHLRDIVIGRIHPPKTDNKTYNNWIKKVDINGFDFYSLFHDGDFFMKSMLADGVHIEITQHSEKKQPEDNSISKMPHEIFSDLSFKLNIPYLEISNADIIYTDIDPTVYTEGKLTFERGKFKIYNLSNIKSPTRLIAEMYVMNQGLLKLDMNIPLLSKTMDFTYSGSLSPMDASVFNSLFAYDELKLIHGTIEASWFKVNVVNGHATGEVELIYHDLKVRVIEKKKGKVKRFISRIANLFLKDENPKNKGDKPEISKIDYKRKDEDTFFIYLWEALSDALFETVIKDFFEPLVKSDN